MKKIFAMILSGIGILSAGAASVGCMFVLMDEPEMSKAMIEK